MGHYPVFGENYVEYYKDWLSVSCMGLLNKALSKQPHEVSTLSIYLKKEIYIHYSDSGKCPKKILQQWY
jgi:hypothetical protein